MVTRLVSGILAAVFLPLGVTFGILGDAFAGAGTAFMGAGLAMLLVFVVLQRNHRARAARRTQRATAAVLEARINHGVQLNDKRQLTLTVDFFPAGEVSGRFFWRPADPIGDRIEVAYDPDDPSNFAPA